MESSRIETFAVQRQPITFRGSSRCPQSQGTKLGRDATFMSGREVFCPHPGDPYALGTQGHQSDPHGVTEGGGRAFFWII